MFNKASLLIFTLAAVVRGQQVGTNQGETHPKLSWQTCTSSGCTTNSNGSVVLDSNWRWTHNVGGFTNCYTGNTWNTTLCPDGATCAQNCALDGADYVNTYGITSSGNQLTLKFVTNGQQKNIGSRVYLLQDDSHYQIFKLLNKEFTFDVDLSTLPCGLNGALYFSQMDADGGMAKYSGNKAGAKYGTGYCDSQCPRDIKFINGEGNCVGWQPSPNDTNAGTGQYGTCCSEMDVWEANSMASAYTPHPCDVTSQTRCQGDDCAITSRYSGVCDPDGCDFNSFRMGDKGFYGPGLTVNTNQKFTVVTQFLTNNNSTSGTLHEIRRIYVQNGNVIQNSKVSVPGMDAADSITDTFCNQQKAAFGDETSFQNHGSLEQIGKAMSTGMVLVLSIWDDHAVNMLWLDSNYPTTGAVSTPGIARGNCSTSSGKPPDVENNSPNAAVVFSNIRFGDIGSTYTNNGGGSQPSSTQNPPPSSTGPSSPTQTKFGQCGGNGYSGPTVCASGSTCQPVSPPWYSQCL